jgi:hypothetical protein
MVKRCDRGIASTPSTPPSFLAPQHRTEPHARGRIGLEQSFVEPSRPTTWPAGFPADSVDLATLLGIHGRLLGQRSHGRSGCPMILSLATVIPKAEISPARSFFPSRRRDPSTQSPVFPVDQPTSHRAHGQAAACGRGSVTGSRRTLDL